MLGMLFEPAPGAVLRVLCIGAHCDDIEIGCGGTLLALQRAGRRVHCDYAVLSGDGERRAEAKSAHAAFVRKANRGSLTFGGFHDGRFPAAYESIKDFFEGLKDHARPHVVFCHERDDRHQDHRVVNEMVWNTFRDQLVLEYEVPKWDGGLGQPNAFVALSAAQARRKADLLVRIYRTQAHRDWFTPDAFLALMRLRGLECRSASGYAEAFHARKIRVAGP